MRDDVTFASVEHTAGFTLIEVMVALVIFSLAALALIRLESATIRGAATLDASFVAQLVARNVAIETMTDAQLPTLGGSRGSDVEAGRTWDWARTVTATGDARIVRIDVAVTGPRGQVLARTTLVRPPDPPLVR